MEVELLLFASLRDDVGSSTLKISLPPEATVATLLEEVGRTLPQLQPKLAHVRVAIGDEFAESTAVISGDRDIALIPPVSGG